MNERLDTVDVAMGFDANYAPHAAGVVASVVALAPGTKFRFIILHDAIGDDLKREIERCAPKAVWVWTEVKESDLPPFADRQYFNRTTLFRLGLEKLAPADCRRVVYLDSDIALLRDVRDLYNVDLQGQTVGAAVDAYLDPEAFAKRWDLEPGGAYMNAGALLVDLEALKNGVNRIMRLRMWLRWLRRGPAQTSKVQ